MSLLDETIARIAPPDGEAASSVEHRLRELFPQGEKLGILRSMLLQYAGIMGEIHPEPPKRCTVICCADHGVAAMRVSAYPPETTLQMTANYLISRGGTANALSNFSGADLAVADLGIAADTGDIPGLLRHKIAFGTQNAALGPAMTRAQALQAVETGIELAGRYAEKGYRCFLPGEMGIANTTSSAAICSVLCGISPEDATGRGTNISDERLRKKVEIVRQVLDINRPDPEDGLDVLAKVGGFELGCIAGLILGAAAHRSLVLLDGFNTGAAALIAHALAPACRPYLMCSHLAAEKGHRAILRKLELHPYLDMHFRLGEATGSSIAVNFLDAAIGLYRELEQSGAESPISGFTEEIMPEEVPVVTDKTFDFYLNTMPHLSKPAMEACQNRLDHLAKPLYSLGRLEQIAVQMAGIADDERPDSDMARSLLCFAPAGGVSEEDHLADHLSAGHLQVIHALSLHAEADISIGYVRDEQPPTAAFDFGRTLAEDISFTTPILGLSVLTPDAAPPIGRELREALLSENGDLRFPPEEFLTHVPKHLKGLAGALTGALIAAAHNSSLIVLDDMGTEIIARYVERLCPDIRPYVLHVQPALLQMDITLDGGILSCLGMKVIDASLHVLNDMKTFRESGVSVANDGPGAERQGGS